MATGFMVLVLSLLALALALNVVLGPPPAWCVRCGIKRPRKPYGAFRDGWRYQSDADFSVHWRCPSCR